jgi:hypothetical protein
MQTRLDVANHSVKFEPHHQISITLTLSKRLEMNTARVSRILLVAFLSIHGNEALAKQEKIAIQTSHPKAIQIFLGTWLNQKHKPTHFAPSHLARLNEGESPQERLRNTTDCPIERIQMLHVHVALPLVLAY